jgi:hypothetical protein
VYITLFSSCLYLVYFFFYVSACLHIARMLMPLKCANLGDILNYLLFFLCFPTYDNATLAIACGKCNTVQQNKYFLHNSQYSLKEQK